MYSGVAGLKNHQVKMDVIGNNIANVNTIGFKASRVVFQDIYSQTTKQASTPNVAGGTNPQQVGMGVAIGSIDVLHTRSAAQFTGAPLDVMIEGDGFFVVNNGSNNFFTRAGNFYTDQNNNLVDSSGNYVQQLGDTAGTTKDIKITDGYYDISIDKNGSIVGINNLTKAKDVIATICIAQFNNQNSLEKMGENLYINNSNTGVPNYLNPGILGAPYINPGALEMSNVDLSKEFTDMIVTQRGFQANSRVITTSDSLLEELVNLKR